jgi:hypothetical protein
MNKGEDGYEIVTSTRAVIIVRTYHDRFVDTRKFPTIAHALRDVLDWIYDHSVALYAADIEDTLALGSRMLAPDAFNTARILAGEACVYVLRIAARNGYRVFTFDALYEQCPMLSHDAVRKAMMIGVQEGAYIMQGKDKWRMCRMTKLAERYESEMV